MSLIKLTITRKRFTMIIISVGKLDLGNNFSYSHFINALSEVQVDRIYAKEWELESEIKIIGRGNYGKVSLHTCGNDLSDHMRYI